MIVKKISKSDNSDNELYEYNIVEDTMNYIGLETYEANNNNYQLYPSVGYTDDYLFLTYYEKRNFGVSDYDWESSNSGQLNIIDRKSFQLVAELDLSGVSNQTPLLFNINDGKMFFYCEESGEIKTLECVGEDVSAFELTTIVRIFHESKLIAYDQSENCVYLRINYGFFHGDDFGVEAEGGHALDKCVITDDINSAEVVYIRYDFDEKTYEIIKRFKVIDIIDEVDCFGNLTDILVGDKIYTFNNDTTGSAYKITDLAYWFSF